MSRVLLVEDRAPLRQLVAAHLRERGFVVDEVGTAGEARDALAVGSYAALVVDLGLPDGDGAELLGASGPDALPALVITARDSVGERVAGLNAGADDYLVKPFDLGELEARLRAILRRPGARRGVRLTVGDLVLDTVAREAWVGSESLRLRRRELLLLEALMASAGRIMVRDVLEERLYGFDAAVTPNALEVAMSRLRRALEQAGSRVRLETRRGIGYRLSAGDEA
jgi:two-component system, OmpR family, response regulator QseB